MMNRNTGKKEHEGHVHKLFIFRRRRFCGIRRAPGEGETWEPMLTGDSSMSWSSLLSWARLNYSSSVGNHGIGVGVRGVSEGAGMRW